MDEAQAQELKSLLGVNKLCVMSTTSSNGPESALVAFAEDEELCLYFQTRMNTRKYKNLQIDQRVSVVIGWDLDSLKNAQYEGRAEPIITTSAIKDLFLSKESPSKKEYLDHKDARFFKVRPTWVRFSDYSTKPPNVWEFEI